MNQKTFKKGEFLFKENDKITNLYFIQSGGVNVCLVRGKKTLDLYQLGSQGIVGESFFNGQATHPYSAVCTSETKVLEVPTDAIKPQFESGPQLFKMVIKSMGERLKSSFNELKSIRLEKDAAPCPEDQTSIIFGVVFHTINHKGTKRKDGSIEIPWHMFKQYSQRVFGESPKKLEQACNILVKLKLANYEMGKAEDNPDGPDEIQKIITPSLLPLEAFFEFYQYYYFKQGRSEILKPDDFVINVVDTFLKEAVDVTPDRFGVVSLDFMKVKERLNADHGIQLNNDHFSRLEQKGAITKRRSIADQVKLEFELKELSNIIFTWRVLKEIDKWNEKGFVDINEKEEKKIKKIDGPTCPNCAAVVSAQMKFCSECGVPLAAKSA
ncbi:MAG: cyclic nucleotide-binding domain-containing protein [Bdellovibrionaceae bacterium]|nr:cyclic nucleotide-binding domain-containing protein [Pseudobdellovibrionaceae bacterium]